MVDGVKMVFRKDKMLRRLEADGRMNMVGNVEIAYMDNLDGCEVSSSCWDRQVRGLPVYSCTGRDGKTLSVYEGDCE